MTLLSMFLSRAAGEWTLAKDTSLCERNLCTLTNNYTWETEHSYGPTSGCALLKRKGITSMQLYGDSYSKPQGPAPSRLSLMLSVLCEQGPERI